MKSWTVSDEVLNNSVAKAKVEALRPFLTDEVGRSANRVEACWSLARTPTGVIGLELNLSDDIYTEGVRAVFDLKEPADSLQTEWNLGRIWSDLLQKRSHRQVERLELMGVE